jgi:hypothetical protein
MVYQRIIKIETEDDILKHVGGSLHLDPTLFIIKQLVDTEDVKCKRSIKLIIYENGFDLKVRRKAVKYKRDY